MQKQARATINAWQVLTQVLDEMRAAGTPLSASIARKGSTRKYALPDGRCVSIRAVVVDGKLKEHGFGFHRFKITPAIDECAFSVFALGVGDKVVSFVFESSEITGLRSLTLRFADEGARQSKYDGARGNWSIIKGRK